MIAYRSQKHVIYTADAFGSIRRGFSAIENAASPERAPAQNLLIQFGEFESAVTDSLSADCDGDGAEIRALRQASIAFGRLFYRALRGQPWGPVKQCCRRALANLAALRLPPCATASVPEGYAYYGLYPATYVNAAERCWHDLRPREAIVIGIRNIGSSLASAVGACFEENGCSVRSYTVRPGGHPFDRVTRVSAALREQWAGAAGALFAVVDEGPGLSGSSFASVTKLLPSIGIDEHRIVLFPSWEADPAAFVNQEARVQWRRHRKFAAREEDTPRPQGRDLSAGAWRDFAFPAPHAYPAVQPQHERRKYLDDAGVLHKFAGLGRYGAAKLPIAERLAGGGFTPPPVGFGDGFLTLRFIPGRPLVVRDRSEALLDRMASYVAFRKRELPAERSVSFEAMLELIRVNSAEGLGSALGAVDNALQSFRAEFEDREAVAVDGRMLPHEWLATTGGFLKTDATDHHADHFFPGGADAAWDLAGAAVEFQLGPQEQEYLLRRYTQFSGDRPPESLLAFYRIAYLSFRLGYCALAAGPTAGSAEHARFTSLQARYARSLEREMFRSLRRVPFTA